ncbi:methylmalonyl Co-A mutase-associated GTPase MeaB [Thermodesulfobacteriota bacterium]
MDLLERMLAGEQTALARLISLVEDRSEEIPFIMDEVYQHAGKADIIGITGPPGAGKSTLVDQVITRFRAEGKRVGVVAIDPSSPFSGGALLGDRIRMQRHTLDDGVFIRSLGTRGSHGGLSRATKEVARILDASGKDVVIVETVGVGQTELDIMELADTTVVVLVPESGDTIQTMKAGLMEIADVFVINKADRDGAQQIAVELKTMVDMFGPSDGWKPPVLLAEARNGVGVAEFVTEIRAHRESIKKDQTHQERRREYLKYEFLEIVLDEFRQGLIKKVERSGALGDLIEDVQSGRINPYAASLKVLADPEILLNICRGDPPGEDS